MPPTVFGSGKLIVIFVFAAVAGLVVGTSFAESLGIYQLRYTFLAQRTLMTGSTPTTYCRTRAMMSGSSEFMATFADEPVVPIFVCISGLPACLLAAKFTHL